MRWETVIGLEIHAQLDTRSKIFSGASTDFGADANRQASAVDLGMPGVLPVLNREAVQCAIKFGLATSAQIGRRSVFARKNYFYPDLPKGYQISQLDHPIVGAGEVLVTLDDGVRKSIRLTRAHLEEDAGKSLHEDFQGLSGIDLNRAGTPLLEIVSEPDMRSASEAVAYARTVHALVRYIGICDGNMQEGSFRVDANVSVRLDGETALGTRTEIKNVNSFRFLERAINLEVQRQIETLEDGGTVVQETRLYDADLDETRSMRSKEEANDYRYFPDPDLLPVVVTQADIDAVAERLPELPEPRRQRFVDSLGVTDGDAALLVLERDLADYFEAAVGVAGADNAQSVTNWLLNDLRARLDKHDLTLAACPVPAAELGALVRRIADNTISGKIAKQVVDVMWDEGGSVDAVIDAKGLVQITDAGAIESLVDDAIAQFPEQVEEYRGGKDKVLGFLVGKVMQASKGKANPGSVNQILRDKLSRD
ncbi:MAG: Asp-tRNA(Asn)/Glu-tRNA(Gln) amidotransferase subunit GatB [Pseudomonadota bacterium]